MSVRLIGPVGCIINVASLLGLKGGKGSAGYAASKAGVIGKLSRMQQCTSNGLMMMMMYRLHPSPGSRSRKIQNSR